MRIVGTANADTERDRAVAKIVEGWTQLVKIQANKVIALEGKKIIACHGAVKRLGEEVSERGPSSMERGLCKGDIE